MLSEGNFLCGPSAAVLLDLPIPSWLERGPVHVAAPDGGAHLGSPRTRGRRLDVTPEELTVVRHAVVTSPARTYCDLAKDLSVPDLAAVGDAVMRAYGLSADELLSVVQRRIRYSGKVAARRTLPLLTPLAESPQESRARIVITQAGLAMPVPQHVVRDAAGHFIARLDLAYPDLRIAIEYDGDVHRDPARYRKDASRRTLLRQLGWFVIEATADDLRYPQRLIGKVRGAMDVQASSRGRT